MLRKIYRVTAQGAGLGAISPYLRKGDIISFDKEPSRAEIEQNDLRWVRVVQGPNKGCRTGLCTGRLEKEGYWLERV